MVKRTPRRRKWLFIHSCNNREEYVSSFRGFKLPDGSYLSSFATGMLLSPIDNEVLLYMEHPISARALKKFPHVVQSSIKPWTCKARKFSTCAKTYSDHLPIQFDLDYSSHQEAPELLQEHISHDDYYYFNGDEVNCSMFFGDSNQLSTFSDDTMRLDEFYSRIGLGYTFADLLTFATASKDIVSRRILQTHQGDLLSYEVLVNIFRPQRPPA